MLDADAVTQQEFLVLELFDSNNAAKSHLIPIDIDLLDEKIHDFDIHK